MLRSWSRPTASTSSRCAKAPTAATGRVSTACTSAPSRGRGRGARRRQAGRGSRGHASSATRPGQIKQKVKLPADADRRSSASSPRTPTASARRRFQFRLVDLRQRRRESSRTTRTRRRRRAALPLAFNGVIDKPGDVDYFSSRRRRGRRFDVHCYARRLGSPLDPVMTLRTSTAARSSATTTPAARTATSASPSRPTSEYVLSVRTISEGRADVLLPRRVHAGSRRQSTVSIPKVALFSQERQTITVPRGNRMATLVSVGRANFGGELIAGARGTAAGRDAERREHGRQPGRRAGGVRGEAGRRRSAGTDEPHRDARRSRSRQIESRSRRRSSWSPAVRGSRSTGEHEVDRTAVAVTEEAPYSIEHRRAEGAAGAEWLVEPARSWPSARRGSRRRSRSSRC